MALIGLRRLSDFNVTVESFSLLFTPQAKALAWKLTGGQPWLVNVLARQAVEAVPSDPASEIGTESITASKETLVKRGDALRGSLTDCVRDPRVQRVIREVIPPAMTSVRLHSQPIPERCSIQETEFEGRRITVARL